MITKEKLKLTLLQLPDQFTIDELIEHLILIDKIERGNKQSENGETISEEKLDREIAKWFE
ncbi:MAG TPA: hypothetical protein VFQ86_11895 [Arachidicoccus soli]|jgi:hypothetical protein|nr:hypothetical protein [Arachidicoccus soli]